MLRMVNIELLGTLQKHYTQKGIILLVTSCYKKKYCIKLMSPRIFHKIILL